MTITENGKRIHVPNPDTKALMQKVFKKYLEPGQSIASIVEVMKQMGFTTRLGRPFTKSAVSLMLDNPFYIGINRFNGTDYPGAQQPIISRDTFQRVQSKMHKGQPARIRKHNPLFKGLITCEECGGAVTWELQKGHYYGKCQRLNGCRRKKYLKQDKVDDIVKEMLARLVCPSEEIAGWVADSMRQKRQETIEERQKLVQSIQTQVERTRRMDSDLYDDKLAGDITKEKYMEKHEQFKTQLTVLEEQLVKANKSSGRQLEERLVIFELSQRASSMYERKPPEQKRIIIKYLFSKLTSSDDTVSVDFTGFVSVIAHKVRLTRELIGAKK